MIVIRTLLMVGLRFVYGLEREEEMDAEEVRDTNRCAVTDFSFRKIRTFFT